MRQTSSILPSNMHACRTRSDTTVLLWLTLAVGVAYANSLTGDFLFDDFNVIVYESQVHSWGAWFASLGNSIRPLLKFSYTLNWTMGAGVVGFHLLNLLIHLVNVYLVYRLATEFVRQQWQYDTLKNVPFFTALLFAVHPIHTEAVTYICGRSSSLMAVFYLAGLLCYVIGRTRRNALYLYFATPLLFLLALGVKETAVTFPFVLLLWEIGCGGKWRSAFKAQWPTWVVLVSVVVFFLFSESYHSQMERSVQFNGLSGNLATQLSGFVYLLQQFALPLWLNIDPDLPLYHDLSAATVPIMITLVLFGLMIGFRRRRPWISFGLAWVMLHLIPLYLLLPRIDIANERQLYLAAWPLLLVFALELTLMLQGRNWKVVASVTLLTCIALTLSRNQSYRNELTLWQDTLTQSPNKARVHNNLGYAYLLAQRNEEARREFTVALQLDPMLYQARYNLLRLEAEVESAISAPEARPKHAPILPN